MSAGTNIGKVLTYRFILEKYGKTALPTLFLLCVCIWLLCAKTEKDKEIPAYIQTHISVGYRMVSAEDIS